MNNSCPKAARCLHASECMDFGNFHDIFHGEYLCFESAAREYERHQKRSQNEKHENHKMKWSYNASSATEPKKTTTSQIKEISMQTDAGTLHIRANPETQSVAIMLDPENGNEEIDIAHIRNFDAVETSNKSAALKNIRVEVCEYEAGECMLHEHLIYPKKADETPNGDD